jgi:hypothetical protein
MSNAIEFIRDAVEMSNIDGQGVSVSLEPNMTPPESIFERIMSEVRAMEKDK